MTANDLVATPLNSNSAYILLYQIRTLVLFPRRQSLMTALASDNIPRTPIPFAELVPDPENQEGVLHRRKEKSVNLSSPPPVRSIHHPFTF